MKLKYIAIGFLCAGFFSCTDDEIVNGGRTPANPGDEILFSANQNSNGFNDTDHPNTRTHYGHYDETDKGHYAIYWDNGDHIAIYSPQARATETDTPDRGKEQDYKILLNESNADSQKGTLSKINPSDVGLQWGEADEHDFFAFYPFTAKQGIVNSTTLRLELPAVQTPRIIRTQGDINGDNDITLPSGNKITGTMYVAEPDMNYCFMYAHSVGSRIKNEPISLNFKPIPTVLEIILKGPKEGEDPIEVSQVVLRCASDMVGKFDLTIAPLNDPNDGATKVVDDGLLSNTLTIPTYYNKTTGATSGDNLEPVTLKSGDALVVRAFMLPVDFEVAKSAVTVHMVGKGSRTKVLDTGTMKAHTINITEMPKLQATTSNYWMTMLDSNVYFSQLSIPGSHNSYNFPERTGVSSIPNDDKTISSNYHLKNIEEQLNAGARAFSFQVGFKTNQYMLAISNSGWRASEGAYPLVVYAGSKETSDDLKSVLKDFAAALTKLNNSYKEAFPEADKYGKSPHEFIVLNITFTQRGGDLYRAEEVQRWLKELDLAMAALNDERFTGSVNAQTTIQDLIGKVVVFVNYQGADWPYNVHKYLEDYNVIKEFVYSYESSRKGKNYIVVKDSYGIAGDKKDFFKLNDRDYDFVFYQPVYNTDNTQSDISLWRQNLERLNNDISISGGTWLGNRISEKKNYIETLFTEAVKNNADGTKVGNWYINNLGCFMIVDNVGSYDTGRGEGGNVLKAASEINKYAYDYLVDPKKNSAPCGVVLMNLFGETSVNNTRVYSKELQQIIIDNNYRFQLKVKGSTSAR